MLPACAGSGAAGHRTYVYITNYGISVKEGTSYCIYYRTTLLIIMLEWSKSPNARVPSPGLWTGGVFLPECLYDELMMSGSFAVFFVSGERHDIVQYGISKLFHNTVIHRVIHIVNFFSRGRHGSSLLFRRLQHLQPSLVSGWQLWMKAFTWT